MSADLSISVKNAAVFQRELLVLSGVTFDIAVGEFVYLAGKVGSGKSSLIRTLNAELPLYEGEISIAGFQLKSIREREIPFLRRKLGVVFQDFRLLTDRTVYKNLHFVLKATGWTDEVKMKQRIDRILDEAGMSGAANKMPHQLSGGEQQRIVIARALLNDPDILLADEPTGNLDPETSVEIMEMFRKIHAEGKTLLVATHDKLVVDRFPGRTLLCREGTIIEKTEEGEWIDFRSYEVE